MGRAGRGPGFRAHDKSRCPRKTYRPKPSLLPAVDWHPGGKEWGRRYLREMPLLPSSPSTENPGAWDLLWGLPAMGHSSLAWSSFLAGPFPSMDFLFSQAQFLTYLNMNV